MLHLATKKRLSSLLHFSQHHRTDLFGIIDLLVTLYPHLDHWFSSLVFHSERQHLAILLHRCIVEATTNETLGVVNCICRV
mmetsp:Transcript_23929/g.32721  ORF Transcript_23929/g.32721 Transcript_23929/m.32721 type:complete len:81 (+) Transcript_23929:763-1005(+)